MLCFKIVVHAGMKVASIAEKKILPVYVNCWKNPPKTELQ